MKNKLYKHIGYWKRTRYFSKRMRLPWYWNLNLFTRISNYFKDKDKN